MHCGDEGLRVCPVGLQRAALRGSGGLRTINYRNKDSFPGSTLVGD